MGKRTFHLFAKHQKNAIIKINFKLQSKLRSKQKLKLRLRLKLQLNLKFRWRRWRLTQLLLAVGVGVVAGRRGEWGEVVGKKNQQQRQQKS